MTRKKGKILIVDDDEYIMLTLKMFLDQHFNQVTPLEDPQKILPALEKENFDVIILDMNFKEGDTSGVDGLNWLAKILEYDPDASVIMMTAYGGVNIAVEAIKKGAKDFIVKPWENERLLATVTSAYNLSNEKKNVKHLKSQQRIISSAIDDQFTNIIGESDAMKKVYATINKVASTNADVLILGENGTGKELVARAIHRSSDRKDEVFIGVDLGSISENLFESELFGHKKGSYTDAKEDRIGRFEAASGGTIFLDEIGNLSLSLQAKLLSVLEKREIVRVGTNQPIGIDVRVICATNMEIHKMVKEGTFREDLLYRINTVEIEVPALVERQEDIPMLSKHFLEVFAKKYQKKGLQLGVDALKELQRYSWPGNVRELQHAMERAVIMADTEKIEADDFAFLNGNGNRDGKPQNYNLEELEEWAVRNAIKKHKGNISHAAEELGLSRGAMYRRMSKYGI